MCRSGDVVNGLSAGQENGLAADGGLSPKINWFFRLGQDSE